MDDLPPTLPFVLSLPNPTVYSLLTIAGMSGLILGLLL